MKNSRNGPWLVCLLWLVSAAAQAAPPSAPSGVALAADQAAEHYLDPAGDDFAPCTSGAPCKTLPYAVGQASAGDIIYLAAGTYTTSSALNVSGLTLICEDRDTTTITGGTKLYTTTSFESWHCGYTGFSTAALNLEPAGATPVSGIVWVDNKCDGTICIGTTATSSNSIQNIYIAGSICQNRNSSGGKNDCWSIGGDATLTNAYVIESTVDDIGHASSEKGSFGAAFGNNGTRFRNSDIWIARNTMSNLYNSCVDSNGDGEFPPVHAIWAFGVGIHVWNNTVSDLSMCTDSEAIYLKADDSTIVGNTVTDGGSKNMNGVIMIKASDSYVNQNNLIELNTVYRTSAYAATSGQTGQEIVCYGECIVRNNVVSSHTIKGCIFMRTDDQDIDVTENQCDLAAASAGIINISGVETSPTIQIDFNTMNANDATASAFGGQASSYAENNTICINPGCATLP